MDLVARGSAAIDDGEYRATAMRRQSELSAAVVAQRTHEMIGCCFAGGPTREPSVAAFREYREIEFERVWTAWRWVVCVGPEIELDGANSLARVSFHVRRVVELSVAGLAGSCEERRVEIIGSGGRGRRNACRDRINRH